MFVQEYCKRHTAHYQTQELTYCQHLGRCLSLSWLSFKTSIGLLIHGLFPGCLRRCGSENIQIMNERCEQNKRRC